jgi:hypothetical protein
MQSARLQMLEQAQDVRLLRLPDGSLLERRARLLADPQLVKHDMSMVACYQRRQALSQAPHDATRIKSVGHELKAYPAGLEFIEKFACNGYTLLPR